MTRWILLVVFAFALLSSSPSFAWTEADRLEAEGVHAKVQMLRNAGLADSSVDALLGALRGRLDEITPAPPTQDPVVELQDALQALAE